MNTPSGHVPRDRGDRQHGLAILPWGLMAVLTVPLGIVGLFARLWIWPPVLVGDADYYAAAIPALVSDAPLYDPASFAPHILPPPPFWDQAPSAALFAAILLLPAGKIVWGALMVACVVAALVILLPRVGPGGIVLLAPVLTLLPPVTDAMVWGNLTAVVLLMFAIAWRWPKAAGVAIGIATAAKLMPVFAISWLIGKRDWRGVAAALGIPAVLTAIVMLLAGPTVVVDFIIVRLNQMPTPGFARWGLVDLGVPEPAAWLLALAIALLAVQRASFSLAVLAVLVAAPALHLHYLAIALVPLFGIWIPWFLRRLRAWPLGDQEATAGSRTAATATGPEADG
jgi:Glycosyltransferase family 87